ncbi:MAG TPA: glycine betaine ABC transporter substrate-binding protein [Thermoanaerobaculia bacterium]|jgi:osmoprotectant transport system permease protein|nr:glycine betaine ABC transporter substrate-binding protein [Thermoanaerobaculia bacterium]
MRRLLALAALIASPALAADRIAVGSKNFEESRLLGETFAQLLESRTDLQVERRLGLAGTQVCFEALKSGAIDVYPEYTGTGLVSILGEESKEGTAGTLNRVRREFLSRWDLWWISPLGFENSFEVAVPKELAGREHLRTISDLARISPRLRGGFGHEFVGREDGLLGLEKVYGLRFASVQPLQHALKYQAAGGRQVDAIDVYTTDARLILYNLVVLQDDKGFFPPYEAAALVRGETLRKHPEVGSVLGLLAGAFDEDRMRALNLRLQEGKEDEAVVARDALRELGLVKGGAAEESRTIETPGLRHYLWDERQALLRRTLEHLGLSAVALLAGILVAVPLGLALERNRGGAETAIRLLGTTQTIPSLALLAFFIPFLGVGRVPAVVALWIYSLYPIVRNTYTGVRDADPRAVEAATALGMTPGQVLTQVRLPLAAPVLLAGIRTAAVLTVGTATLAAFIGAGGLGEPIVTGLQLANSAMILSGAIPAAVLALVVDALLGWVERALRPRGVEARTP